MITKENAMIIQKKIIKFILPRFYRNFLNKSNISKSKKRSHKTSLFLYECFF